MTETAREKRRAYARKYYNKHRDEVLARQKADRDADKEAFNAYARAARAAKIEAYRARERQYYADHIEAKRAYGREYYRKNKAACQENARRWQAKNRKKRNEEQIRVRAVCAEKNAAEAKVFRAWRKAEGLSQAEVGQMLGVVRASVSLYEQGKCKVLPYDKYMTVPSFAAWLENNKEEQ